MQHLEQMQSTLESMKLGLGRMEIAASRLEKALRNRPVAGTSEEWRHAVAQQLSAAIADIDDILK